MYNEYVNQRTKELQDERIKDALNRNRPKKNVTIESELYQSNVVDDFMSVYH